MFVTHNVLYANLSVQFVALPNADLCFLGFARNDGLDDLIDIVIILQLVPLIPNTSSLRCHDTHFYKVAQRIIRSLDLGTDRRTTSHEAHCIPGFPKWSESEGILPRGCARGEDRIDR